MCRLLYVRGEADFDMRPHLAQLAEISRTSREYQGHGWGCAWREGDEWRLHHDIRPIWEVPLDGFGSSTLLLAHARSAFRDEGIVVENNMPFCDGERIFIFNGELRGVRIKEEGRIGAEKVFNYVKRFHKGDLVEALRRGVGVIEKRTRYVRAMNMMIAEGTQVVLATLFNEEPGYFQMHRREASGLDVVCSDPYPGEQGFEPLANRSVLAL